MLVRAIDRSEAVYNAMLARGFDGQLRAGMPRAVTGMDIAKCIAVLAVAILMIAAQWRWIY